MKSYSPMFDILNVEKGIGGSLHIDQLMLLKVGHIYDDFVEKSCSYIISLIKKSDLEQMEAAEELIQTKIFSQCTDAQANHVSLEIRRIMQKEAGESDIRSAS